MTDDLNVAGNPPLSPFFKGGCIGKPHILHEPGRGRSVLR